MAVNVFCDLVRRDAAQAPSLRWRPDLRYIDTDLRLWGKRR